MAYPTIEETAQFVDDTLRGEVDPDGTGKYNNRPGSDNAALVSVMTKAMVKLYAYSSDRKRASITSSASGSDLDDHIRDVYFDQRKQPAAAVGTVYLKRTGAMAATSIDVGSRFGTQATDTQEAVEYEATGTVPAGAGVSAVAVPIKCLQEGTVGNVDLASITQILDPLEDSAWQLYVPIAGDAVLNGASGPDSIGGGADEESDDEVKARVQVRPALASPGTAAGVYKGATDIAGIVSAVPIEVGDGTGVVYAGDANDQLPSAKQLEIAANLEDWRPFGVPVDVRAFNRSKVQITASVYMQQPLSNYDLDALKSSAVAAVKRYFTSERKRLDEYFVGAIATAIGKSNAETQEVVVSSPASDQRRSPDSAYGAITALTRYYVDDTSINVTFYDPLTS